MLSREKVSSDGAFTSPRALKDGMRRSVVLVAIHGGRYVSKKATAVFACEVQLPQRVVGDITHLPVTSIFAPSKSLLVLVGIVPLVAVQAHAVTLDTCLALTSAITLDCPLAALQCHVLLELSEETGLGFLSPATIASSCRAAPRRRVLWQRDRLLRSLVWSVPHINLWR